MPIPDAVLPKSDDSKPITEGDINNVIAIQNDWLAALLACEIPDKQYSDCIACSSPRCTYAWLKLQTLWPEIGDWPPKPVKEFSRKTPKESNPVPAIASKLLWTGVKSSR